MNSKQKILQEVLEALPEYLQRVNSGFNEGYNKAVGDARFVVMEMIEEAAFEPINALPDVNFCAVNTIPKDAVAKRAYGDQSFDCAVPQGFLDEVFKGREDEYNPFHFITLYPKSQPMGRVVPITVQGKELMESMTCCKY